MSSIAGPEIADISHLQRQLSQEDASTAAGREAVLTLSRSLIEAVQDPAQRAFEIVFTYSIMPCLRVAADLDIFNLVNPGCITAQEIARVSGADKDLIVRIMRILNAGDIFKLVGEETYSPTPVSSFFCLTPIRDGLQHMFDMGYRPGAQLPEFLRRTSYRNPANNFDGPHQFAFDTKQNWFTWMEEHKQENDQFNNFMEMFRAGRMPWFELFPAEDVIITGSHDKAPLLVDVGGGHGHDLSAFRDKFHTSGRLIVEDLPRVIAEKQGSPLGVECVVHDFFTEQPVEGKSVPTSDDAGLISQGARAYLLKTILHDWPDEQALQILKNIVPAMKRGYSKVLIAEQVLPIDQQVPVLIGGLDLIMMLAYAAKERTERQWMKLLGDAGLMITNVWSSKTGDSIIEATLR